jgi:hypothetical protein
VLPRDFSGEIFGKICLVSSQVKNNVIPPLKNVMTRHHPWLQDLEGVNALAILTDADLLSHENGHALFYDGLEPLLNQCIIISADPEYFLDNLKDVILH